MTVLVNIIGAGNLGRTIGSLIVGNKIGRIGGVFNKSKESSINAINFMGDGTYYSDICDLPSADITFLATSDDVIPSMCQQLCKNKNILPGSTIIHFSGSLTSDTLSPAKQIGCNVASIHPMRSFARPEVSIKEFPGTYCAMEGDSEAVELIRGLFNSMGAITYLIEKEKKSLYHAAGVFASNYLVTLSNQALNCLIESGVEKDIAMRVIANIMKGTVLNLETTLSPEKSLTGPIQRGDISTIKKHLNSFSNSSQKSLYSSLGEATIDLTTHDTNKKSELAHLLCPKKTIDSDQPSFFLKSSL